MNLNSWWTKLSLKQKVISALLSCSLGSAIFIGIVMSNAASKALHRDLEEKLDALISAKAQETLFSYSKLREDLNTLAVSKFIQDALVAYESVAYGTGLDINQDADLATSPYFKGIETKFKDTFDDYLKQLPFNSFSVVLNGGSVVSQTGATHLLGKNIVNGRTKGTNLAKCFTEAREHQMSFTGLYSGFDGKGHAYFCSVIRSKYDRDGYAKNASMGVMIADLNWEFFNKLSKFDAGLGQTGEIFLTDKAGALITAPRTIAATSFEDLVKGSLKQSVDLNRTALYEHQSYADQTVYVKQRVLKLDEKNDWIMVAQVSKAEAEEPVRTMQIGAAILLLVCGGLVSFVGYMFASSLARRFNETGSRMASSSHSVGAVSDDVSAVAASVRSGSQQQSSAIHETSVSLEELTQMVARTAELSSTSKDKSARCANEAATGLGKIESLMTSIERVDESSNVTLNQIDKANQSFQELLNLFNTITAKTQVINDIAFQTKLLSFNASVEAARAGEHGKGFAVVAEEVGHLAISVSSAAGEINNLLSSSSAKMNSLIDENRRGLQKATSESKNEIEISRSIAVECNQFFVSLSSMVSEINREITQISSAAAEQTTGISEINRAVSQISIANDDNVQNSNVIFELSHRLHSVTGNLVIANSELNALLQGDDGEMHRSPSALTGESTGELTAEVVQEASNLESPSIEDSQNPKAS